MRIAPHIPMSTNFVRESSPIKDRKKFILSFGESSVSYQLLAELTPADGGGVRILSSILIVQHLMDICGQLERNEDHETTSSYYPIRFRSDREKSAEGTPERKTEIYLPAHYFDYIGRVLTYSSCYGC